MSQFIAKDLTLGDLNALVIKLGGEKVIRRIIDGELEAELTPTFKVWKTIRLGTGLRTAEDFASALIKGTTIADSAVSILNDSTFQISKDTVEVDLVRVSIHDLYARCHRGVVIQHMYIYAMSHGLELCSAEVGPQLRLQYVDQPKDEVLFVGMEEVENPIGVKNIFCVRGDGRLTGSNPDNYIDRCVFVFVKPRKS